MWWLDTKWNCPMCEDLELKLRCKILGCQHRGASSPEQKCRRRKADSKSRHFLYLRQSREDRLIRRQRENRGLTRGPRMCGVMKITGRYLPQRGSVEQPHTSASQEAERGEESASWTVSTGLVLTVREKCKQTIPEWWGWEWETGVRFGEDAHNCSHGQKEKKKKAWVLKASFSSWSSWVGASPGGTAFSSLCIYQWSIWLGQSLDSFHPPNEGLFYETAITSTLHCMHMDEKHIYDARKIKFIGK